MMTRTFVEWRARHAAKTTKICFIHVPKCGGDSISRAIAQSYSYWDRLVVPNWYVNLRASRVAADTIGCSMNDLREAVLTYKLAESRAKFVTGHVMCRPKTREAFEGRWIFITLLRDPVKRWISEFVYNTYGEQDWLRNTLPIDEYVDSPVGLVSATKYLEYFSDWRPGQPVDQTDVDRAVANLRRFAVVGTLENLPAFTADVVAILGRKVTVPHVNASPRRDMVQELLNQPDLVARVRWLCRHDKAVYDQVTSGEPSPAGVVA